MAGKKFKSSLWIVLIIALLAGAVIWREMAAPVTAGAEHGHGHGHGHEEGEDAHDHAKEEHGHDHAQEGHADGHGHGEEEAEGIIALSPEQISASGIKVAPALSGTLAREISVPGKILTAADRMAEVAPKIGGTVAEVFKNIGDKVEKDEVLARLESREMAEAVADYLAAKRAEELARGTYNREKGLWEKKITAEQEYLNARNAHQEAKIRYDLTRQKLQALGHTDNAIRAFDAAGKADALRFHEIRSPIAGRIIERSLTLGSYIEASHKAFAVADLSVVWVEVAIPPTDLSSVKEGQTVTILGDKMRGEGKMIFVNPVIDTETRSAKAIIELENGEGLWLPGTFVHAAIASSMEDAEIIVPKDALQIVEGADVVFVRSGSGFERRAVKKGREDSKNVEILSGLEFSEPVAISNTFAIKAELGKSEAEHEH